MRIKKKYVIGIGLLVILIFLGYLSFGKQAAQNKNTITVGIMAGSKSEQEIWDSVAQTAKKRYGLELNFKDLLTIVSQMLHYLVIILM